MSEKPKLIVVAQIAGAFGVKGEARIRTFTEDPEAAFAYGPLTDAEGKVVLTPLKHRPLNEGFGVTAKEQRQREEWEKLKGTLLHVLRDALPEADEDEVYVTDLIGLRVEHVDGRVFGVVKDAPNYGAGDLIEIQPESGPSFLIPFTHADVPEVDLENRVVKISPDEAMLPDALQRQSSDGGTN